MNLVEVKDLKKQFSKGCVAIDAVTVEIPPGEMVGVVGPDGAGKTTLLRLLAGLLKPTVGHVLINGFDTIKDAEKVRTIIGYMPQKFGLYEDLTVMQNLSLYADLRDLRGELRSETFEKLLQFTSLASFVGRLAGKLSGGMKQKLGLACALMKKPTLLLLDEPSVGVDPLSRRELWKMVHKLLEEGISVVWSTAYLDEAEKCDRVVLLNEGKLLYFGEPQSLAKPRFEDGFREMLGGSLLEESVLAKLTDTVVSREEFVITAENLTKKFDSFIAVDNVSFSVAKGEIFGLLGPNGAGKSTIFKMLCGLLHPTGGHAFVDGISLEKAGSHAKKQIGYMAQKFSLYGALSVEQNLRFFSGIYGLQGKEREERIKEMSAIFHLEPYLTVSAEMLPLGFKQRLALACATMHRPKILFLDEATSGVDPLTRAEFWNHIKELVKKGITVMITTHFMEEAEYCDRVALIYQGRMIHLSDPTSLKEMARSEENQNPTLEDAFITLIEEYDNKKC